MRITSTYTSALGRKRVVAEREAAGLRMLYDNIFDRMVLDADGLPDPSEPRVFDHGEMVWTDEPDEITQTALPLVVTMRHTQLETLASKVEPLTPEEQLEATRLLLQEELYRLQKGR